MRSFLISFLLTTATLHAGTVTLDLNPLGGSITGGTGDTVGWGFKLTNSTADWISVTSSALTFETSPSLGVYTDFIGPQSGPAPSFALPPFTFWSETFDGVSQGIGSYAIASNAALFAQDSGQILVSFDEFNGDPTNGAVQTGSSKVSAEFTVNIAPAAQVPEPSTLPLVAAASVLIFAAGWSRIVSRFRLATCGKDWLRGMDLNHRPLGYEPNELPDCSTPHCNSSAALRGRQTPASSFRFLRRLDS
jgi:hypothetical protein